MQHPGFVNPCQDSCQDLLIPTSAKTCDCSAHSAHAMGKASVNTQSTRKHVANSPFCSKRRGQLRDPTPAAAHAGKKKVKGPVCGSNMAKNTLKKHHALTFLKQDDSVSHLVTNGKFLTCKFSRKLCVKNAAGKPSQLPDLHTHADPGVSQHKLRFRSALLLM